jgi:hypothetical protein
MKDDSWERARGEKNGDHGGGWKQDEARTESISKSPDVLGGKMGEDETGLDIGDGLDLWSAVSY